MVIVIGHRDRIWAVTSATARGNAVAVRMNSLRPHPEDAAFLRGRLEGWQQARPGMRPSFETRRKDAALPRMRSE
jgi:hypothetical protein